MNPKSLFILNIVTKVASQKEETKIFKIKSLNILQN